MQINFLCIPCHTTRVSRHIEKLDYIMTVINLNAAIHVFLTLLPVKHCNVLRHFLPLFPVYHTAITVEYLYNKPPDITNFPL